MALAKSPDERQTTCRLLVSQAQQALGIAKPAPSAARRLAVVVPLVAVVAALATFLAFRNGSPPTSPEGDTLVRIDPATNSIVDRHPVGARASAVTVGQDGFVWVTSIDARTLVRIDPRTGRTRSTKIAGTPIDVAVRGGLAVVANGPYEVGYEVIDAVTGAPIGSVQLPGADFAPVAVASGETGIWVAASGPDGENVGRVTAPSLASGLPTFEQLEIPPAPNYLYYITPDASSYADAAAADGSVWLVRDGGTVLKRLDERRRRVLATTTLPFRSRSIAVDARGAWVTAVFEDAVARLDPATGEVTMTVPLCRGTDGVAIGAGSVWVACALDGVVVRIDPASGEVVATIDVGGRPEDVVVGDDGVWVTRHRS